MRTLSATLVLALLAACNSPLPDGRLRFWPEDPRDWSETGAGQLVTTALGARCSIDLNRRDTRIWLVVDNEAGPTLSVAVGAESARDSTPAVGERRLRPVDSDQLESVRDFVPYRSLQAIEIEAGWRAEFFLDNPLGREPTTGTYLVLVLEVRAGENLQRRLLPLVASRPASPRR